MLLKQPLKMVLSNQSLGQHKKMLLILLSEKDITVNMYTFLSQPSKNAVRYQQSGFNT